MKNILKTLVFIILVPGTVAGLVPYYIVYSHGAAYTVMGFCWMGLIPLAVGLAMMFWSAWGFATVGLGTPAPIDPPKKIVTTGLYRYIRNPMYVAVVLALIGETTLSFSLPLLEYSLAVFIMFNLFVFLYEEPHLRKTFGKHYELYCRQVPRWLPKFYWSVNERNKSSRRHA